VADKQHCASCEVDYDPDVEMHINEATDGGEPICSGPRPALKKVPLDLEALTKAAQISISQDDTKNKNWIICINLGEVSGGTGRREQFGVAKAKLIIDNEAAIKDFVQFHHGLKEGDSCKGKPVTNYKGNLILDLTPNETTFYKKFSFGKSRAQLYQEKMPIIKKFFEKYGYTLRTT
jgi:hypothetical protein